MDVAIDRTSANRVGFNAEAVSVMLYGTSFLLLAASMTMFAQAVNTPASADVERWIAPIMMALTNLMGSVFAFLTAREIRHNDSEKTIQKADLKRALEDNEECKQDRERLHSLQDNTESELNKALRKIDRLMARAGLKDEDDDERRGPTNPGYRGPKRRKEDGSQQHKPLPPGPEAEGS